MKKPPFYGRRIYISALLLSSGALLALQAVRPTLTNPSVTADLKAPPEVKQILRQSCYDCHSNETKLRWFDQVVPVSWLVARDVMQGRARLNFSEIGAQPPEKQSAALYEAVNQIQLGAMPLPSYRRVHTGAAVTPAQLATLRAYVSSRALPEAAAVVHRAGEEQPQARVSHVSPAPNGVAFLPDYRDWQLISSTDRFDNQTLRVVLGNKIAIRAIAENQINVWPDGTSFAKVAWSREPNADGTVRTGAFQQVEFMIKDRKKYAATKGWGWGRWRGRELKPYGVTSAFTDECIGCHAPLQGNDYVFTMPIQGESRGGGR